MTTPRVLRPVPDPLGSYIRPGRNDHKFLLQMLVEDKNIGTGLIADPTLISRQRELVDEACRKGVEAVFDPRTVELSTRGGFVRSGIASLPWAGSNPHVPADLRGLAGVSFIKHLGDAVEDGRYTAVLAPTHCVLDQSDEWLSVDAELTRLLRRELNSRGLERVPIYYPLVSKTAVLLDQSCLRRLVTHLALLPIDAVWLRLHPFGTTKSGPLALRRYLEICRSLHVLELPVVAERSGTVGVALAAFGAVGGVESGVTDGEGVDLTRLWNQPNTESKGFSIPRIYLHEIGAFMTAKTAQLFFDQRGMKSAHGCTDATCCPRGWRDMQLNPRAHFVRRRAQEIVYLSTVPATLRAGIYLENVLRPASDKAVRAAAIEPTLTSTRKRLDSWRGTLGKDLESRSTFTTSAAAAGKRLAKSA